eukprot:TRINITY_DN1320_c0_g1_i1.p1 TRINITY_DN1320_c0_g1~~TRINITY_DN1320_c0_g1_i1.p1  ORF type:complete len:322 (-),score=94.21 TRINITY_DN1320_c0_g1_i1:167-1132(-)
MSSTDDSKAKALLREADTKATAFSFFGSSKKEEAVDLYSKAAAQFKIVKQWDEAAKCYLKAAELSKKLKNDLDACNLYADAGRAYKNVSLKDAIANLRISVVMHTDNNRFSMAAKMYKEIADLEEKNNDLTHAMESYKKAAEFFMLEDAKASSNQCLLKVADHSALKEDYKAAIDLYEKVSTVSLEQKLLSYSVKDYMFKSLLCHFVMDANQGQVSATTAAIEKYKEMNPQFELSRECKVIENTLSAFKNGDVDQFTDHLFNHDRICKLDNWSSELFLKIKQKLQNPTKSGTSAEKEPDLQSSNSTKKEGSEKTKKEDDLT